MQITNYPFQKLPFSELYKTYLNNFARIGDFYEVNPFDAQAVERRANKVSCKLDRATVVDLLHQFNSRFEVAEPTLKNIERFKDERAVAIVTGQQLGVYGGPAYTIYKTLTAVHLAGRTEKQLGRPVIPVFWLADEDHDYDEVNSITLLDHNKVRDISLPDLQNHLPPVSELKFTDALNSFRQKADRALLQTDFTKQLWKILDACFKPGFRFDEAFGNFISNLFSKHGLVLAGSNFKPVKKHTKALLKKAITSAGEVRNDLDVQTGKLQESYHQQVTLYDSNLFYIGESGRVKIIRNGKQWKTDAGEQWKTDELLDKIERSPHQFSPNVFLRPVLQDNLLPTLGYVAGPGETAYYGQMKTMYRSFDMTMPVIFPRMSATIIEPAINRIMKELPFELHEYDSRIEDLETAYVDRTEKTDIEGLFSEWRENVEKLAQSPIKKIKGIDPTLEGAAGRATAIYLNELDKLRGKVYRAVKKHDKIQLKRIRRIKAQLFPAGGLQERNIAAIYFMNKYGVDIWDRILEQLDEDEMFREHKLIYV